MKAQEKKLDVAEMRMLRWMSGVTKLGRIRNDRIKETTKVGEISKKVQESRLKFYGHVLRRRIRGQECDGDGGAEEGEEDYSVGGWITPRTTCRRDNGQGRKRTPGLNGGVS